MKIVESLICYTLNCYQLNLWPSLKEFYTRSFLSVCKQLICSVIFNFVFICIPFINTWIFHSSSSSSTATINNQKSPMAVLNTIKAAQITIVDNLIKININDTSGWLAGRLFVRSFVWSVVSGWWCFCYLV